MPRQILVTAALPYANGHIHIGHLVEYIQTDIWVRFQKLRGHRCIFVCADDTHGTAIMIRARREGRSEEAVIADMREAHMRDFAGFQIQFDNYGSTNSPDNKEACHQIWAAITTAGLVKTRSVEQLFDPVAGTFLADRFVRGTCPRCTAADQPGDNCSVCGAAYTPADLRDPRSILSNAVPELRSADHLFIELEQLRPFLEDWSQNGGHLQSEVARYLKGNFLGDPLRDWDISRPAPYFGFEIPDHPGNYWYVWFDAPIGYIGSTREWCRQHSEHVEAWWGRDSAAEIHHFIGKDITYFHTLFWPGMLHTAGLNLPSKVHVHGFLTVDGEKMSKSKGTFLMASTWLRHLPPGALRYYYSTKLGPGLDDIDLNVEEFVARVNTDLVNKVVNLASRCAGFLAGQTLADTYPDDGGLFAAGAARGDAIAAFYEDCNYNAATREIMALADRANKYVDDLQPWVIRKDPARGAELRDVCSVTLNLFRQIVVYLSPVLPGLAQQTAELLNNIMEIDKLQKRGQQAERRNQLEAAEADLAFKKQEEEKRQQKQDAKTTLDNIAKFQEELCALGYKYQFITLAGIHINWYNTFQFAHAYARGEGMKHYVEMVQEPEFKAREQGYTFVSHQQEVGVGYFDDVTTVIQGGSSSVKALAGSTEEEQFH